MPYIPEMKKFYVVYRVCGSAAVAVHNTRESANLEAVTLAEANVGSTFVVLEALYGYACPIPKASLIPITH